MELSHHPLNVHSSAASAAAEPTSCLSSMLRFVVVTYLVGVVILSVEQFLALPSNLASVDLWNLLFLPACWLYLIYMRQPIRFPYALGMWLILLGNFIGTLFSTDPLVSILFIAKEVYLYVWFVTLVAVFANIEPGIVRRILIVWLVVVVLHAVLLVAEFVSPNFYTFMNSILVQIGNVNFRYVGRPPGLFENPIWAAFFEMMGFVPLLLVGLRRELTLLLGLVLLLGMLATASLSTFSALLGASAVAVIVLLFMGGYLKSLVWLATVVTLAAVLFFFSIRLFPDVLARLEHLTTDRAEYTTDQRLDLWQGGSEALFSRNSILGVGPNNYRDSFAGKTLHNDFLEFGVERGIIGLLGLALLTGEAWNSAIKILRHNIKFRDTAPPVGVIFLAMLFAVLLESIPNQIFHFRAMWLGLALLEATLFKLMLSPTVDAAFARQTGLDDKRSQTPAKL